ncbi:hypothetical protein PMI07_006325 [Rhizobium sp. CF080]|uniref:hypothetical protein n=1 Tax=Rhizobium sp. (strain CF080) TaxID=1144310 RepID=UPI0002718110|nr:hypothetical protein [Rhizobium sp. CF080]EUC00045.1 hypothetical protein PMI07_006325 [Rhizobium sp. CF080]
MILRCSTHAVLRLWMILFFCLVCEVSSVNADDVGIDNSITILTDLLLKSKLKQSDPNKIQKVDILIRYLLDYKARGAGITLERQTAVISQELLASGFTRDNLPASWTGDFTAALSESEAFFDNLLVSRDPTASFLRRAKTLADDKSKLSATNPAVVAAAALIDAKLKVLLVPASVPALAAQADAMVTVLQDADSRKILLLDKDSIKSLAALRAALLPFEQRRELRVHLLGALYGDVDAINSDFEPGAGKRISRAPKTESRWCIASAALIAQCERQAACQFNDDYKNLCGFDPAPFAPAAKKALVVFYDCRANDQDSSWTMVPETSAIRKSFTLPTGTQTRVAALYSKGQSFRCSNSPN